MVSVSCSQLLLSLVTVIVLSVLLNSYFFLSLNPIVYESHQAIAPLFPVGLQTLTEEFMTVSKMFGDSLVLSAVLEH